MKADILNRSDIEVLVKSFYEKVKQNHLLGPIFADFNDTHWSKHLSVMCDFWENILLFTGNYQGNPMDLHKHLHKLKPLTNLHFQEWNRLFVSTVDDLFDGEKALLAKQRAVSISNLLQKQIGL